MTVAVDVPRHDIDRVVPRREDPAERAVPDATQRRRRIAFVVRGDEIELAVAIEIRRRDAERRAAHRPVAP